MTNWFKDKTFRRHFIFFLSAFLLSGCYTPKFVKEKFKETDYCFKNRNTNITGIFLTDGYYQINEKFVFKDHLSNPIKNAQIKFNAVFYSDGMFLRSYDMNVENGFWGSYYINGDTLKCQTLAPPGSMSSLLTETWFLIINKTTIQYLHSKSKSDLTREEVLKYTNEKETSELDENNFTRKDNLPDPNISWLKAQKWFWCDKDNFKSWRKNMTQLTSLLSSA